MKKQMQIPIGATIRVKREDGQFDIFIFRGTHSGRASYEDEKGAQHPDVGVYTEIALRSANGWTIL